MDPTTDEDIFNMEVVGVTITLNPCNLWETLGLVTLKGPGMLVLEIAVRVENAVTESKTA